MLHDHRHYTVKEYQSLDALAAAMMDYTWGVTTGFKYGGYLFLNDSFSENGAQEYAVIKDGNQIESWTVSWFGTKDRFKQLFAELDSSEFCTPVNVTYTEV